MSTEFENFKKIVEILNATGIKLKVSFDNKDIVEISAEGKEIHINIIDIHKFTSLMREVKK